MKKLFLTSLFVLLWVVAICADRYMVNITGSVTWNGSNTAIWSATSGGASGASVPTSADNVIRDANSGSGTVSLELGYTGLCASLNCTGASGTIAGPGGGAISVSGNATLASGMTLSAGLTFVASGTLTQNGATFSGQINIGTAGITVDLGGDINCGGIFMTGGTLTANNYDVTVSSLSTSGASAKTINMGSGTWTLTGSFGVWTIGTNTTVNASTSTIKCTDTTNFQLTFAGGGKTYNNLWFARGGSTGELIITGANTFNDFKDDGSAAHTITFPNVTTTVTTFTVSGSSGNVKTLRRTGGSGGWTISASSGTICRDYLSISNSTATGGASFYAGANSTDGGGNTGWTFTACPSSNTSNFFFKP